ncbi:MAG: AAA family ATPase, partial [Pseudomonadota bacterium]
MTQFATIDIIVNHLRTELKSKKTILLFAYNGTGKTRLSMAFKEQGKKDGDRDTLYFNAFTEDLFSWDNDLDGDSERKLKLNKDSEFFKGLDELEMDNRIRPFLNRYVDFDFRIDTDEWVVRFSRELKTDDSTEIFENIKVSRGEENIFIWCFFLAVVQLAMDKDIEAYSWVKYIYIDDPISSLDENNAVAVAHHLAQLLKEKENMLKTIISSHHTLFFNVLH